MNVPATILNDNARDRIEDGWVVYSLEFQKPLAIIVLNICYRKKKTKPEEIDWKENHRYDGILAPSLSQRIEIEVGRSLGDAFKRFRLPPFQGDS